jgi:hypothetical protein
VEDDVMFVQSLDQLLHMVRPAGQYENNSKMGWLADASTRAQLRMQ